MVSGLVADLDFAQGFCRRSFWTVSVCPLRRCRERRGPRRNLLSDKLPVKAAPSRLESCGSSMKAAETTPILVRFFNTFLRFVMPRTDPEASRRMQRPQFAAAASAAAVDNISDMVAECGALPEQTCVRYLLELLDAVEQAAAAATDRDCCLSRVSIVGKVLLRTDHDSSEASTDHDGAAKKSLPYCPPETDSTPEKVAVWSLGVFFFCMLAGYAPFAEAYVPSPCLPSQPLHLQILSRSARFRSLRLTPYLCLLERSCSQVGALPLLCVVREDERDGFSTPLLVARHPLALSDARALE